MKKLIVCLLGAVSILTAQKSFTYKFQDAPTGPSSRSYQIDVSKTNVHFVVVSGDKNYFDENRAINKYQYKAFIASFDECYIGKKTEEVNNGCTGGTTETIIVTNGNKVVEAYVYNCGGTAYGNMKGEIAKAVELFKSMVPGFEYKMSTTRLKD